MSFDEWNLKLSSRILSCINSNGFLSAVTKAERGYGKSMYNLKVMALVYYNVNNCSENSAWTMALDNMFFTPDQLMDHIDFNIENDVTSPVWCIDDASVHFSNLLFFVNVYQAGLVNAAFDTIRTVTNALLINCPNKDRLVSSLKGYDDYEITLYKAKEGSYNRKSVAIKWFRLPSGKRNFTKQFEDYFSVYVPNWIYRLYMEKRKMYLKDINRELRSLREKLIKKRSKKSEI